ncbi:hypothetical protein ACSSV4_003993 [Roseovarius sp. MBR-154]|jgi:hypothetical protein
MQPAAPLFISTSHEMTATWEACQRAPDGPGKTTALTHAQAAQAAFEENDDTGCLEQCRAAVAALD